MEKTLKNHEEAVDTPELWKIENSQASVLAYLALLGLADKFIGRSEREICKEIGRVSMDLIEPEFATLDRRNLIAKKNYLEQEFASIQKLKELDKYEKAFIENARSFADTNGIGPEMFLNLGVPRSTLKSANII